MVRRTCTAIAVLAQADTQLSPIGVTWGSAALGPCSLRIRSQELTVRHGPIVLRWPRKRAANATSNESKRRKQGRRETRTRVKPSTLVFCPTPIAPKTQNPRPHPRRPGTGPTSAPTSAARPLIRYFRIPRTVSRSSLRTLKLKGRASNRSPPSSTDKQL